MRKFEKPIGVVIVLLVLYSLFFGFEINLYVTLRIGLIVVCIFYLWFGFFLFNRINFEDLLKKEVIRKLNVFKVSAGITMGVVYSFCTLAIMFSIYFYAGMNTLLGIAIIALISATALIGIYNTLNMPMQKFYNQFYRRSLVIGVFLLFIWFFPVEKRLSALYKNYPEFIEAYTNYQENPDDKKAEQKLREARNLFK